MAQFQDDEKVLRFINSKEAGASPNWAPPAPTTFSGQRSNLSYIKLGPPSGLDATDAAVESFVAQLKTALTDG